MTAPATIDAAGPGHLDACVRVLADAFGVGPLAEWLVPDDVRRPAVYRGYWRIDAEHALRPGSTAVVDVARADGGAVVGAAFWYPVAGGGTPDLTGQAYDRMLAAVVGDDDLLDRWQRLDLLIDRALPKLAEDWAYLGFLAVAPTHQRRGVGTALLAARHRDLDRSGTPAFLIASSPDSARLYARHGYRRHADPVELPEATTMYPMLRPPGPPPG